MGTHPSTSWPGRTRTALAVSVLCLALVAGSACTPSSTVHPGPDRPTTPPARDELVVPRPFPTQAFPEPAGTALPPDRAAAYQAVLDGVVAAPGLRGGVTAAVFDAEDGTWVGAVGSADGVRPMTPEDQLAVGTITESVVAAAVMRLVEGGLVDLDTPVAAYLPDGLGMDPGPATVRQLLGMRSGIQDIHTTRGMSILLREDRSRTWTPAEVLTLVGDARLQVGRWEESATNYLLLGLVVENVIGLRLAAALRSDVLAAAGIERLVVQPDEPPSEPVAGPIGEGFDPQEAVRLGSGYLPSLSVVTALGGSAAMASDAGSLARWWAHLCGGRVVSRTALGVMMPTDSSFPASVGLGLSDLSLSLGVPAVGQTAEGFGYGAVAACLPTEGTVVVVLTNNPGTVKVVDVADDLMEAGSPR